MAHGTRCGHNRPCNTATRYFTMSDTPDSNAVDGYARLRVDLHALQENYRLLANTASPSVCGAVVKADAYGLGMLPVSRALHDAGCRQFFVSEVFEGVALRQALAEAEIYILSGITNRNAEACISAKLIPVLANAGQVDAWRSLAGSWQPAAVKVDTGMTRLGFHWDEITPEDVSGIDIALLLTHLACADTPRHPLNQTQIERFRKASAAFPDTPTSIGNTAGTITGIATRGDLCRCGIGLYGGNPFSGQDNPFRAVAHLEGQVLQMTTVTSEESIGYGASFTAARNLRVATLGIGYANGLPRALSNIGEASLGEETFPIVGRVSMNLTTIAVLPDSALRPGDWVEFIGATRPISEVANLTHTIDYEILTGLRATRIHQP